MNLESLPFKSDAQTEVTIAGQLTCLCPVGTRRDHAEVSVAYYPTSTVIELASFARYLETFVDQAASHEAVTVEIADAIREVTNAEEIVVTTTWSAVEGINCTVRVMR